MNDPLRGTPAGLFSSVRGLGVTALALLGNRLDLLGTELVEERGRLLSLVTYGAVALLLLAAGLVFLSVFITVLLWDSNRLLALGVFSGLFLAGGLLALGMTLGFAAVQAVNLLRIISLYYLGQWNLPVFEFAHLYLWQALIMLDVLVVWLLWIRWTARRTAEQEEVSGHAN